jgi:chaperonin GroES
LTKKRVYVIIIDVVSTHFLGVLKSVNHNIQMDGGKKMSVKIRPLGDRVIVEPIEEEEQTIAGGKLVLPDTAKEKPQHGVVLAVGPDVITEDEDGNIIGVQEGDLVIYAKYGGTNFKTREGQELLILREDDILGVIEE